MNKIYEAMDIADCAYLMHDGKLSFEISPEDKYILEGREIIFGAEEPLLAHKSDMDEYFRFQTVYAENGSSIAKIPLENLYKLISTYNIGFSITKNIAKFVELTNQMYLKKEKKLSGKEMASKEYARMYVETVDILRKYYNKLKIGWLKQVVERFSNSLVFTKGQAFKKSTTKSDLKIETDKLGDYTFNLKSGSIVCEEGDIGNEMFVLNRGSLEIYIGSKKVADVNQTGTVIGEMALLLEEKRSATVKTVTDCNITIIKPDNLENIASDMNDFFLNMAVNMGKRLEKNCNLIRETNNLLVEEGTQSAAPKPPSERQNYKELLSLIREMERYHLKYKFDWMGNQLKGLKKDIAGIRVKYS
jgi:CRP-like cAMP-binding protein